MNRHSIRVTIVISSILVVVLVFVSWRFHDRGIPIDDVDDYRIAVLCRETKEVASVLSTYLGDDSIEEKNNDSFILFATSRDKRFLTDDPIGEDDDSFAVYLFLPPREDESSIIACTSPVPKGNYAGYRYVIVYGNGEASVRCAGKDEDKICGIPVASLPTVCPKLFYSFRALANQNRATTKEL